MDQFRKVVNELFLNAYKYSKIESSILVIMDIENDKLRVSIANSPGKDEKNRFGIPVEFENIIFEPFFRLRKTVQEEYNTLDFGLGLTLVEKIVLAHGGTIGVSTVTDITDFKLMETQLLKEKIRAEEYDRAKSTFLANMSHEFRTPLNSILGFTKMLSESISNGEHDCDKALEYLGYIDKGGEKLLEIVNDLILMSRIEAGMFTIANSNIDIGQIVKDVVNKFSSEIKTAKESGIVFNIVFPKNAVVSQIFADKDALKIILQHILSNAIKYTEKGLIQIGYKFTPDDGVEFFVSDTGKGISKEDCKNIFTSFYRVDVSKKREKGGIGLGLSISLKLARMMNSEIKYDSTPGKGSRFSLKLFFAGDRNV